MRLLPADPLRIEVPATADRLAEIRHLLVAWLEPIGVPEATVADIVLAVNEAATNCVEHAYRDIDHGTVVVEATIDQQRLVISVADHGSWQAPSDGPTTRGRGLLIMRAVGAGVDVSRSATGTTVRITFDIGAPQM
ncbi:anti-sigma regulatory factor [Mycolicibacterium phlei]|nr:Serine-protein kinase RsbW [Mycolicibacterium phlei]STZ15249.1 anti-sigma regulatory factor [Mycolicibacterium phlei]VEG07247.1 anti-sigma regulatory factor [Mycobacteroides chelonae]